MRELNTQGSSLYSLSIIRLIHLGVIINTTLFLNKLFFVRQLSDSFPSYSFHVNTYFIPHQQLKHLSYLFQENAYLCSTLWISNPNTTSTMSVWCSKGIQTLRIFSKWNYHSFEGMKFDVIYCKYKSLFSKKKKNYNNGGLLSSVVFWSSISCQFLLCFSHQ